MSSEAKTQASAIGYERCERLLNNPDLLWFIDEAVTKARSEKEGILKDLATSRDDREIAAHVRDALEQVETFLTRRRDIYARDLPQAKK